MVFVLMQNAHAVGQTWGTRQRFKAILSDPTYWWYPRTRTGERLRLILPGRWTPNTVRFYNTTPEVGVTTGSKLEPDEAYVAMCLAVVQPDVVLATGKQAEETVLKTWKKNLVVVPHPTFRCLTNRLYIMAGRTVARLNQNPGLGQRWLFKQERGYHITTRL